MLKKILTLILYFTTIILDLYTTYLCSPNLEREGAWDFKTFKWGWTGIIVSSAIYFVFFSTLFIVFNFGSVQYFKGIKFKQFQLGKLISFLIVFNFTISFSVVALSNFLYYLDKLSIDNILLKYIIDRHSFYNDILYTKYSIIWADLVSYTFLILSVIYYVSESQYKFYSFKK